MSFLPLRGTQQLDYLFKYSHRYNKYCLSFSDTCTFPNCVPSNMVILNLPPSAQLNVTLPWLRMANLIYYEARAVLHLTTHGDSMVNVTAVQFESPERGR